MNFNNPFNTVVVNQEINPEGTGGTRVEDIAEIDTYYGEPQNLEANEYGVSWTDDFMFYDENDKEFHGGRIAKHVPIVAGEGVEFEYDAGTNLIKVNAAGGSGGTTLNKYTVTTNKPKLMSAINQNAKGRVIITDAFQHGVYIMGVAVGNLMITGISWSDDEGMRIYHAKSGSTSASSFPDNSKHVTYIKPDNTVSHSGYSSFPASFQITYYNDTEITV